MNIYRLSSCHSGQSLASGGYGAGNHPGWLPYTGIRYDDAAGLRLSTEWWNADTRQNLPQSLNNAGQAVGISAQHGLFWNSDGTIITMGTLGGTNCRPLALNNSGQAVGVSDLGVFSSDAHAFLWSAQTGIRDLGALPGQTSSVAYGINDSGCVTGRSGGYSFLWTASGGMTQIGSYGDDVTGINNDGVVIGYSYSSGHYRAFAWSEETGLIHLPLILGASNSKPTSINSDGDIVGYVWGSSEDNSRAVLWGPVPEPATLSLLALGGLAMLKRWKH